MQQLDEGYIKYDIRWKWEEGINKPELVELINCRNQLKMNGLIGSYENGIGFGNISCRLKGNEFIISGTQTGDIEIANESNFSYVYDFDISKNLLFCRGPVKASSEALTHAAFYAADININAVIHVHDLQLWNNLLFIITTTEKHITYGTPEMANAIIKLLQEDHDLNKNKILVMAGHEEGIFTFGSDLKEARKILNKYLNS